METYFAADGSYGDASGLVVMDTSEWTSEAWDVVYWIDGNMSPYYAGLIQDWQDEGIISQELQMLIDERD